MNAAASSHSATIRTRSGEWADRQEPPAPDNLFSEQLFYQAFRKDCEGAKREVVIYSPFVSRYRVEQLRGMVRRLTDRNVDVFIFTRPPEEYDRPQRAIAASVIESLRESGAAVFCPKGSIHAKAAVVDRAIVWEGSLNILSQRTSRELMRRTLSGSVAEQVIGHLSIAPDMADGYQRKYERLCGELGARRQGRRRSPFPLFLAFLAGMWITAAASGIIAQNAQGPARWISALVSVSH